MGMGARLGMLAVVAASGAVLFGAGADAAPIAGLYATGVDNAGTVLANGSAEQHYSLVANTNSLRVATSANGFPIPPWLGDNATSAWVGPNTDGVLTGVAGFYDYRITFSLAGLDASTAVITGQWASDDIGRDILVNGVSSGNTVNGFSAFAGFSLTSGFVAGLNTLDFIVENGGGPTGLRVQMSGTANAVVQDVAVPEPASLALLGAGLLGAGMVRRRRAG